MSSDRRGSAPLRLALATGAIAACGADLPLQNTSHYAIDVEVRPEEQVIDATVDLAFVSPDDSIESLSFYLHKQLELESVDGDVVSGHSAADPDSADVPYMPEARAIHVRLNRSLTKGERVGLQFAYSGVIDQWPWWSANYLSEEWVELGLYFPWFPYNHEEYGSFTFEVDLTIDSEYEIRSVGTADRTSRGWRFESPVPTNDIVLAGATNLRTRHFSRNGHSAHIYYYFMGESDVQRLGRDVVEVLATYSEWFGEIDQTSINMIQSKRSRGGGYSRPGLIVLGQMGALSEPQQRADLLRYVFHEIAHMWWRRAPATTWEDWLNESFAEYSALLALGEQRGEGEYQSRVGRKVRQAEGTHPIWDLNRSDFSSDQQSREIRIVLYNKGPVLLHELAERVGRDRFLAWCGELVSREVSATADALAVLGELEGTEVMEWFEGQLRDR